MRPKVVNDNLFTRGYGYGPLQGNGAGDSISVGGSPLARRRVSYRLSRLRGSGAIVSEGPLMAHIIAEDEDSEGDKKGKVGANEQEDTS